MRLLSPVPLRQALCSFGLAISVPALLEGASSPPLQSFSGRLRGKVVATDGRPVSGTAVTLVHARDPGDCQVRTVRTDTDGCFAFDASSATDFVPVLEVHARGIGRAIRTLEEGLDHAGLIVLRPGADVTVSLSDQWERALDRGIVVEAQELANDSIPFATGPVRVLAQRSSAPEQWLLRDVPEGSYRIVARDPLGVELAHDTVDLVSGRSTALRLRYTGPDLSSSITCRLRFPHGLRAEIPPERVRLYPDQHPTTLPAATPIAPDVYRFEEVPPGTYALVVEDPRFHRWSRAGVRPGDHLAADIVGNAGVILEVVDWRTKAPITEYSCALRATRGELRPIAPGEAFASGCYFGGLPPGDYEAEIEAPGYRRHRFHLRELRAWETKDANISLIPSCSLEGRVLDAEGTQAVGIPVVACLARRMEGERRTWSTWAGSKVPGHLDRSRTDDNGCFRLESLPAGEALVVLAEHAQELHVLADVEALIRGERGLLDDSTLHSAAWISGRILLPDGVDAHSFLLRAASSRIDRSSSRSLRSRRTIETVPDRAGRYRIGPFPDGVVQMELATIAPTPTGTVTLLEEEVEVRAREDLEHDLDLRKRPPCRLSLTLISEAAPDRFGGIRLLDESGSWTLSADAHGVVSCLFPASRYELDVPLENPVDIAPAVLPNLLELPPGKQLSRLIEITGKGISGSILFVWSDGSEDPLRDRELTVWCTDDEGGLQSTRLLTDERGMTELTSLPRKLYFQDGFMEESHPPDAIELASLPRLEWGSDQGSHVVRLP